MVQMTEVELLNKYAAGRREFSDTDLSGANLLSANLSGANTIFADLSGANTI
jgi:uncharacterized protein YjbI with pentapeptide repeats